MKTRTSLFNMVLIWVCLHVVANSVEAEPQASDKSPLAVQIGSTRSLNGTAGDYVTITAQIRNTTSRPIDKVTTYLSLADEETKLPVDLEDWSAEKGLFIETIDAGQTLPLQWKIHFVKPGAYSLIVVAEAAGNDVPQTSTITRFYVKPKHNLNPGHVLPVALGMPVVLLFIMVIVTYKRNSKVA